MFIIDTAYIFVNSIFLYKIVQLISKAYVFPVFIKFGFKLESIVFVKVSCEEVYSFTQFGLHLHELHVILIQQVNYFFV